jgi:hypothetical protein
MEESVSEMFEAEERTEREAAEAARRQDIARKFVAAMESFINDFNCPEKEALQALACTHPTLQQGVVRFFIHMAEAMAGPNWRNVDGRNEAAVAFCKKVAAIEDKFLPFI